MRSALAKGLGVAPEKVNVEMGSATVDLGGAQPDMTALAAAMKETSKYSVALSE